MGTNYYIQSPKCECCGQAKEDVHIGKQSFGWAFLFSPEYESASQWFEALFNAEANNHNIVDEYGRLWRAIDIVDLVLANSTKATGFTAGKSMYGPGNPAEHERLDSYGFRISKHKGFC